MGRKRRRESKSSLNEIEQKMLNLLKSMKVSFKSHVDVGKYNVDFLVNDLYIVECYGDYWHCNPRRYNSNYFNKGKKKLAVDIWKRDEQRKKTLEKMGYKFFYFWENEINNDIKSIKAVLKRYINRGDGRYD